jgi:hypothetical protein
VIASSSDVREKWLPASHHRSNLIDEFTWRHPEWWAVLAALVAWAVLLLTWLPAVNVPIGHAHHAGAHSPSRVAHDLVCVVAMMTPQAVSTIRRVAYSNFRYRTDRSIACFLAGFLILWLPLGVLIGAGVGIATAALSAPVTIVLAAIAVVWWSRGSRMAAALRRCDRPVALAPHGWRADREHLHLGAAVACSCAITCVALMTLAAALWEQPLLAFGVATFALRQRYGRWVFARIAEDLGNELRWAREDLRALMART